MNLVQLPAHRAYSPEGGPDFVGHPDLRLAGYVVRREV